MIPTLRREGESEGEGPAKIVATLELTCDACPVQWEGLLADGRHLYIRARHGGLTVSVGPTFGDAVRALWPGDGPGELLLSADVSEFATPDELKAVITAAGVLTFPGGVGKSKLVRGMLMMEVSAPCDAYDGPDATWAPCRSCGFALAGHKP